MFQGSKRFSPFAKSCRRHIHGVYKKIPRVITERNEETRKKILWRKENSQPFRISGKERAERFSPTRRKPPFLSLLRRAILLDQLVTKRYKNVFHSWGGLQWIGGRSRGSLRWKGGFARIIEGACCWNTNTRWKRW